MVKDLSIRVAGEAGLGTQTIGFAMCHIFKNAGLHVFLIQDSMSRIRGGNNFIQLRVSRQPVQAIREQCDIVVTLDRAGVLLHGKQSAPGGIVVVDKSKSGITETNESYFDVPLYAMAQKAGESDLYVNSAACGVLGGLTRISFDIIQQVLESTFANKGPDIIGKNVRAAREGYGFAQAEFKADTFQLEQGADSRHLLLNGNEAMALAAIQAGCKFYSAYPMSPSTSIMETLAGYADKYNMVVEQAEDEIAAVNMALGASFAGVRAMTGTSGGGFALMTEGLSLAAMTETPLVIVVAQRPGPATGFPTRTEQADLDFILHAGHGEFARVVFTPGSIEEAFHLTFKAFDLAEKYQVPVILMTDQYLADSVRNVDSTVLAWQPITRHIISREASAHVTDYQRYRFTESVISPRAVPSWITDVVYADSDEHTEAGHITEDPELRVKMVEKRFHRKMELLALEAVPPVVHNAEGAGTLVIGFGSTYGVIREALQDPKFNQWGHVHFSQVWPFPEKTLNRLLIKVKKIITVENNAGAQLARLIKRETGIEPNKSILKYDGRPFDVDYLVQKFNEEI